MMKKKLAALILSGVTALAAVSPGTVFAADPVSESAVSSVQSDAEALSETETIGENLSETDYRLLIKNSSGKEIKTVALRIDQADYTDLALSGEGGFLPDETRCLFCTPKTKNEDGSDVTKPPVYDLKVTFVDGKEAELHTLPFGDADSCDLRFEEPVAYIVFTSKSRGEEFDTLLSEKVKNGLMTSEEAYGSADDGYGGEEDYDDYDDYDYDYDSNDGGGNACLDDAVLY